MADVLGEAVCSFAEGLAAFRAALSGDGALRDAVLDGTAAWVELLEYKLTPRAARSGCLVAAVAGGTNTGKSTVFNLLVGRAVSPVRENAAATCRPVLAANGRRAAEALSGMLFPEFHAMPLEEPAAAVSRESDAAALFVVEQPDLPDHLVLIDTPDVDSIDRANWAVADHLRAASDVVVAVLTGEKYNDERVVAHLREARAAGRVVLPVMNKANPADGFATARRQLEAFAHAVGLEHPACFVAPHDFELAAREGEPVRALDGGAPLRAHLEGLDPAGIQARVLHDTVLRFAGGAEDFLARVEETAEALRGVVEDFEGRAASAAAAWDPAPGGRVGRLLHAHLRRRRGVLSRNIGVVTDGLGRAARRLTRRRAGRPAPTEAELLARREEAVSTGTRNLLKDYTKSVRSMQAPADRLVGAALASVDAASSVDAVRAEAAPADHVSAAFENHVERVVSAWWDDHAVQRKVLMELDALLLLAPTAVAVPMSVVTHGFGAAETVTLGATLGTGFVEKLLLHQLGDRWLKLLKPWREEQQAVFRAALLAHVTEPALAGVRQALAGLESDAVTTMRESREACLRAL